MFAASLFRRGLCLILAFTFVPLQGSAAQVRSVVPSRSGARPLATGTATTLVSDSFGESASAANAWSVVGSACLTAGTTATPATSIPACGSAAPQDAAGAGTLQLNGLAKNTGGMVLYQTPLSTANGLVITFSYAGYGGNPYIGGYLVAPLVAAGHVYVPADGSVGVFGLSQ